MRLMLRFTLALAVLSVALSSSTAKAQASIYGTVSESAFAYSDYDGDANFNGYNPGFGGGLTYVFVHRAVNVGVDVRDTYTPNKNGGNTAAASIRLGFVPPPYPCHPYFQIGPGIISAKSYDGSNTSKTYNSGAVALAWGLDVRVAPNLDIRAIEISIMVGGNNSNASAEGSFSAGVVYHFHSAKTQKS